MALPESLPEATPRPQAEKVLGPVGYVSYGGGVNMAALNHRELRPDQLAAAVNCSIRGGWIQPRDGYSWLPLNTSSERINNAFQTGIAQGAHYYPQSSGDRIIYAIGGRLYTFNPITRNLRSMTVKGVSQPFDSQAPQVWMEVRAGCVCAQDGINKPTIIDGKSVRFAKPTKGQLFGGTVMADGWGMLALASKDGRRLYFSNHEDDPTSDPFDFTDGTDYYLNAPWFSIPARCGPIVGMAFLVYVDSASGLGPLIVLGRNGSMTYDVSAGRSTWATANIARMTLPNIGASSSRCIFNGDSALYFRDHDGRIRSLQSAVAAAKSFAVERFDREISPIIRRENRELDPWTTGVEFGERALFGVLQQRVRLVGGPDVRSNGIASLNIEVASNLSGKTPPAWEGIHTGIHPQLMTRGQFGRKQRCIVASLDNDNVRRLYEIVPGQHFDIAQGKGGQPERRSIQWGFVTGWKDWDTAMAIKQLDRAFISIADIRGEVMIEGFWRISESSGWLPWFETNFHFDDQLRFGFNNCEQCSITEASAGEAPRLALPALPDLNDPVTCVSARRFNKAQFAFRITGFCRVQELAFEASLAQAPAKSAPKKSAPRLRKEECPEIFNHDLTPS